MNAPSPTTAWDVNVCELKKVDIIMKISKKTCDFLYIPILYISQFSVVLSPYIFRRTKNFLFLFIPFFIYWLIRYRIILEIYDESEKDDIYNRRSELSFKIITTIYYILFYFMGIYYLVEIFYPIFSK